MSERCLVSTVSSLPSPICQKSWRTKLGVEIGELEFDFEDIYPCFAGGGEDSPRQNGLIAVQASSPKILYSSCENSEIEADPSRKGQFLCRKLQQLDRLVRRFSRCHAG